MLGRRSVLFSLCLVIGVLSSCSKDEHDRRVNLPDDDWTGVCLDQDGDGFGMQCQAGTDCDDSDAAIHTGCGQCDKPNEGCDCAEGAEPLDCSVEPELTKTGSLLCKTGTRYCRDKKWTACEGLTSFTAPTPSEVKSVKYQGLVATDAGAVKCDYPCNPDCYKVEDTLSPWDSGADATVVTADGGGITVGWTLVPVDAGGDGGYLNNYTCVPGTAPDVDCDGIPDSFDTAPDAPPFQTDNTTLFMNIKPGQSASQNLNVNFKLASADIYFLLDMTASMDGERDNLVNSLTTGDFITSSVTCSDRNYDGVADSYLEQQGVAGNIACLIRDARFGAGWFRDIPFSGYASNNAMMFEHRVDITTDVDALRTSINQFQTVGGNDYPEGGMEAMWPMLTGGEVYAGWDRSGVPRRNCPTGYWGWPCFRNGAVPIIIHITDDEMHEGPPQPSTGTTNYLPYTLVGEMNAGTAWPDGNYLKVYKPGEAEDIATAMDFGDVGGKYLTYAGNTEIMQSNMNYGLTGVCPSSTSAWAANDQGAPDAVFKFSLSSTKTIQLSTNGSRFDSTILLMKGTTLPTTTTIAAANNGTFASAQNLGTLGSGSRFVVSGDTSSFTPVYGREGLSTGSSCFYNTAGDVSERASVMKFQVGAAMNVRVTSTGASPVETALLTSSALEPTGIDLTSLDCGSGTSSNCNDIVGDYSVGDMAGRHLLFTGGNTSLATSDYTTLTCSGGSYSSARDQVVDFSLTQTKSLRFETGPSGSAALSLGTGFSHGLFLFKKAAATSTTVKTVADGTSGDQANATLITAATDVPTNGNWVSYRGSSASDVATYAQSEVGGTTANVCHNGNVGAATSAKDIVFKLVVPSTDTFEFDTATPTVSDGYRTWLTLHKGMITRVSSLASSNASEQDTASGQQVVNPVDGKRVLVTSAQMSNRDRSYQAASAGWGTSASSILLGNNCGNTGTNNGRDTVFRFTTTNAGSVRLTTTDSTGVAGTQPAFRTFMSVFKGSITAANRKSGDCPSPTWGGTPTDARQNSNAWSDTIAVDANSTYYVVVKEWRYSASMSNATGSYGLTIEDASGVFVDCDSGSSVIDTKFSRSVQTLSAGTYYIVLKGSGSGASTKYALNVRRAAAGLGTQQGCANSSSNRTVLDAANLAPGDYSLVLKGQNSNNGSYTLTMRDLGVAPAPTDCANSATAASFTSAATLSPGVTYYLVTRGNTNGGTYQVMLEDSGVAAAATATTCDDDSGTYNNSIKSVSLTAGTYYAIVKGWNSSAKGWFQLSIGETSAISSGQTFAPKKYLGAGGVKAYIQSTKARVLTVYSGDTTKKGDEQSALMSQDSTATSDGTTSGTALEYNIPSNGTMIGDNVVSAVNSLVNALKMNLTIILSQSPDAPPVGQQFGFTVQALGSTSNCNSVTLDTDSNGLKDTYQACGPGAAPDWKVTFTNPLSNPVPNNPSDPNGGYNMKLLLVGDRGVPVGYAGAIVDQIPVYIIPNEVIPPPTVQQYQATGTYEQTLTSGCTGTDVPTWRSLDWNASIPNGTSIEYKLCGGNTDAEVAACTVQSVGVVTSTNVACTTANQATTCGAGSFCDINSKCATLRTALSCDPTLLGTDCGSAGVCINGSGGNKCQFTGRPIDVAKIIAGSQGKKKMRMQILMNSSSDRLSAPTVYNWRLDYYCSPGV